MADIINCQKRLFLRFINWIDSQLPDINDNILNQIHAIVQLYDLQDPILLNPQ